MRILIVSHCFPPKNVIGSVRVGKLAKFLVAAGHDVRVLTADEGSDRSLPLEIDADRVLHADEEPARHFLDRLASMRPSTGNAESGGSESTASEMRRDNRLVAILKRHYYAAVLVPDGHAGWTAPAMAMGEQLIRDWRPDLVFASSPPVTGLIVARRLAGRHEIPFVLELRDPWADNPYYRFPEWRRLVDRLIERRTLRGAAALVSVTPPWAADLRRRYKAPVLTVLNGFAPEDFSRELPPPAPGDVVEILYTGNIYAGFRDPTPLFEAIDRLGPSRGKVVVRFYGPPDAAVRELAARAKVGDRVSTHARVGYAASLALQRQADVLLLLQWNNPKDEGNIPAKFFEYIGAGRPILLIGYEKGVLAQMIRERSAGIVANDPAVIAQHLSRWIQQRPSGIPPTDAAARAGLSRDEQFAKLEAFLREGLPARAS